MLTEVSSNETQYKEDGTFLRKSIITLTVTEDRAGTYFCMAQNPSGFTLSATELIVSDREYLINSLIDSSIFLDVEIILFSHIINFY
jgi:Immunoglobulin domain